MFIFFVVKSSQRHFYNAIKYGASKNRSFERFFGVPGGIRTRDLLIRSQALYPAELQAHKNYFLFDRRSQSEAESMPAKNTNKGNTALFSHQNAKRSNYLSIKSAACQAADFLSLILRNNFAQRLPNRQGDAIIHHAVHQRPHAHQQDNRDEKSLVVIAGR